MISLKFKKARCFKDTGGCRIAPITVLLGENSTGKSSFLGLARCAFEILSDEIAVSFNKDPFYFGSFDQISHYRGGRGGRSRYFDLEVSGILGDLTLPRHLASYYNRATPPSVVRRFLRRDKNVTIIARFRKKLSRPYICKVSIKLGNIVCVVDYSKKLPNVEIRGPGLSRPRRRRIDAFWARTRTGEAETLSVRTCLRSWTLYDSTLSKGESQSPLSKLADDYVGAVDVVWRAINAKFSTKLYAFAPMRTKPERTYNPVDATPKAEGSHVPLALAQKYFSDQRAWRSLRTAIEKFGRDSGLFDSLSIKALGKGDGDPFQLLIKIFGPPTNVVDVGYGVSQVLPIIYDILTGEKGGIYLLQQPEVHLHPRGQAALGSFLFHVARRFRSTILIETHSDYLLDRIRLEMRALSRGQPPEILKQPSGRVSLMYFRKGKNEVSVNPVKVDRYGNLTDTPPGFREFFIEEDKRILTY